MYYGRHDLSRNSLSVLSKVQKKREPPPSPKTKQNKNNPTTTELTVFFYQKNVVNSMYVQLRKVPLVLLMT